MGGPSIKRGESRQDYCTPVEFVDAIKKKFGHLHIDLAATAKNNRCAKYITPKQDSLSIDWYAKFYNRQCWLNPPFGNIRPWAKKCSEYGRKIKDSQEPGKIFFLTPASVGSNWFIDHVWPFASIYFLQGRLTFGNEPTPYPKDCILSVFERNPGTVEPWDWRK